MHEEGFLPIARNSGGIGEFGRCWSFFMPRPEVWILENQDGQAFKQYTMFTGGNLVFFECDHMPFGLCNVPATFQWLMQNCLGELNLTYYLIYLDDIVIFSQMAEEHLYCLFIVFDKFRQHNLKMKPSKCSFFAEKNSPIWHIEPQRMGCNPVTQNLEAIAECMPPQTYMEVHAFLGLVGHYRRFIKGFPCIAQPFSKYLAGEGASRKSEWVQLTEDALKAFKALKQACMTAPILAFADYTKPFLLEADGSKDGLGAELSQKQADWWYAYGSRALTPHKKNYHPTKTEFLALKWAVMENFKE